MTTAWGQTVADMLDVVEVTILERAAIAVKKLNSCNTPLLIVLDNVESWSSKQRPEPLPQGSHVHLLVTTRRHNLGGSYFRRIAVDFLQKSFAVELLNDLSGRDLTWASGIDDLLEYLGGHALAVELAGVYLCEFPSESPQSYLELLSEDASVENVVAEQTRYERTVYQSFMAIWEQLNDAARSAWQLAACFAPEPASYDLATAVGLDKNALRVLRRWHLISDLQQGKQWTMHRLNREFGTHVGSPQDRNRVLRQFVEGCARYADAMDEHLGFQIYGMDRTHLDVAVDLAPSILGDSPETVAAFQNNIGGALRALGEYAQARKVYQLALESALATFGPDHSSVARYRHNLAMVLQFLGELEPARELYQLALESDMATFGPNHPIVATRRHNLAGVLQDIEDLTAVCGLRKRARELYQLSLESEWTTFGPDHPIVATRRHNLAGVLRDIGELEPVRHMLQLMLESAVATFGPGHPSVARYRHNLAMVLQDLGELEQARDLLQLSLESDLATLGPNHPIVAARRHNLAGVLQDLGELEQARDLLQLSLESALATLGPEHPTVARIQRNLATVIKKLAETQ